MMPKERRFAMLNTNQNLTPQLANAATSEIINEFFFNQDAETFNQMIWDMYLSAVCSPISDTWEAGYRAEIAFLYKHLTEMVTKLEHIKKNTVS